MIDSSIQTVVIRNMLKADLRDVASIHLQQFPNSRTSNFGGLFVRKMYKWFASEHPALAIVAEQEGHLVGFVTGATGGYGKKIFRYAFVEILLGTLTRPKILLNRDTYNLWQSYMSSLIPDRKPGQHSNGLEVKPLKASIGSIAVKQEYQGMGIAKKMLMQFESSAKAMGVACVGLSVDAENQPARKLYEACQWQLVDKASTENSAYYQKELK